MLVDVQTVDLHLSGAAEADGLVDDLEDEEHDDEDVGIHHDEAQQLDTQLAQTAAVEQTLADAVAAVREEADGDGAPDAVCKVDGDSAHGVVDLCDLIEELDAQHHEDAGHKADEESAKGRNGVAACGDGDQTGQRAVQGHGDIRLAIPLPGEEHGHAGGHSRRKVGVEADQTGQGHGLVGGEAQGRAAVEAEPAEPEDEHAQSTGGQVVAGNGVGLAVLVVLADAGPQQGSAQHGDDTADVVDGCGTGKVMETHALQPAAAPHPVAADGVDHQRDGCGVDAVGFEVGALGHRTGNDGGGRCAEDGLEHDVHPQRDVEAQMGIIALNEGVEPADESAGAAEHQAEADEPVAGRADAKIHHIFHEHIAGVLGAGEACLAEREASLHEVDEERSYERPTGVDGAEHDADTSPMIWLPGASPAARTLRLLHPSICAAARKIRKRKPSISPLAAGDKPPPEIQKALTGSSSVSAFAFDGKSIERFGQSVKSRTLFLTF